MPRGTPEGRGGNKVGHHRFAKVTITLVAKVPDATPTAAATPTTAAAAAAAKPPEPDEGQVKGKIKTALEQQLKIPGVQLVDVTVTKYEKTPDNS